ncbi:MAG: DEAD/DEAH box helicase family protein [Treponemataceae bacterium]|nr:DEAD/DEAH box helicase family protein [Treponemataceae bacterium]
MKFKFKIQDYQTDAVNAVVEAFAGQPFNDRLSYLRDMGNGTAQGSFQDSEFWSGTGFGNAPLELSNGQLLDNIRALQVAGNIRQSQELSKPFGKDCRCALDIEMETGTGKTYCYIKTMFELNKKYGWSKFIVVVPSIAIREGVKKSFEVMEDHFFEQYGKKARHFIYNSKNLNQLDNFSASKDLCAMIINSQAFASSLKEGARNEAARIIYSKQDSFGSRRPIDVIAANRPIVILDEPQKLGGNATQASIKLFNPLFSLNYSATHRETHNLVYVLDALDAYQKKLVKKIEVKGFELRNLRGTDGFVYLSQILLDPKKPPMARMAFEVNYGKGIKRETRVVGVNDNLYNMSAGGKMPPLEQYKNGYVVKEVNPINNTVTFLNGMTLAVGEVRGDLSEREMRRIQIRETILSHFEKEEKLFDMGVKCLSLFFIDEVAHYRQYDENGSEALGDFGQMFEQEYKSILDEYLSLFETPYIQYLKGIDVHDTHRGYFSIDKKTGHAVNSVEKKGACDDISAYDLILKNKERLLSFDEPTRFIFSHSALREGWDNPNVFQICTLKQSNSEISKRQEVGRGMRLCVNQAGDRIDSSVYGVSVHDINVLTVIASDSYKSFAGSLQKEIKDTLYERPAKATKEYFTGKIVKTAESFHEITAHDAAIIERYLGFNGYIDYDGNITDAYRAAQESGNFAPLPSELAAISDGVHRLVQGVFDESIFDEIIAPANKPKIMQNALNENFAKKEFQTLWKYINHKYAYSVSFDSDELIAKVTKAIDEQMYTTALTYISTIGSQGKTLDFTESRTKTTTLENALGSNVTYDLVGKICHGTALTRKTVVKILQGISPETFAMFRRNPEEFISKAVRYINEQKATMIVDEITYNVTSEEPYSSDIFTAAKGVVDFDRAVKADKHITPFVVVDSDIEKNFAMDLERNDGDVCVYAKLPRSFKIPTPVGDYSPDWAIAFNEGMVKYIYFIAETKGSMESMQLKKIESAKISCAKKLFEKLGSGAVRYDVADTYQHLMDIMRK